MEVPVRERDSFVDRVTAGDAELRREVRSLLAEAERSDGGFDAGRRATDPHRALQAILATALGQQYEIVRPLGHGGMGAVYLARERALERFVAIKVLRPDLAAAPDGRERFRREARVAAQLSHAGILPLHTFGEVNGIWYFVMGYVRGVSLAERLRVEERVSAEEAHRILTELAEALECAHRNGVIHRDIKPANILLDDESGRAMLADFGISKVHGAGDSLTGSGVIVGTPHYMSPEQSLGVPTIDERSDIYSLGAVGYKMLSGREPFADVALEELTFRRLSHDPVSLLSIAPLVPQDLASVVMRCLARDPDGRWPNARALRDALTRASGDSLSTLPESLRDLPTFGPYALLWAALWTALAARTARAASDSVLLMLIAVLVPFGFLLHLWNTGSHGVGLTGLGRVAFWPPEWWGMWWPRALRRPTDLWRRLPWPARAVRVVVSVFLLVLPTMILLRDEIESVVGEGGELQWFGMVESGLVIGVAIATVSALIWCYRRRLSWSETARMLVGATTQSSGWATPTVARLLADAPGGRRPSSVRDTPADHLRAIVELVPLLHESAASVGAESVTIGQRLVDGIEACDAQIVTLSRDASVSEIERLTARLTELDTQAAGDSTAHRELIALVRRELDVVREMRVRCEVISQQRVAQFNALRGLWTHLCLVRDSGTQTDVASSLLSQARAVAHSRLTVAADTSSASAVSAMLNPPK